MSKDIPQAALGLAVLISALLTFSCGGGSERTIEREVELLVGEAGRRADVAELRLVARGRSAILFLETGLYDADPRGRRRVIRALQRIGHIDAAPILAHLAKTDPDADVRAAAAAALEAIGTAKSSP